MLSPFVNTLTPILRLTLEALYEQGELAEPQRAILIADVAGTLDQFSLIFPGEEGAALVAQGRQELKELLRACREGDVIQSAAYALKVVKTVGLLEELKEEQSLSTDFRLENLLFLLRAHLEGAPCDEEVKSAARAVGRAAGEWRKIQEAYISNLDESKRSANEKGFELMKRGFNYLLMGEFSRTRLDAAYQALREGAKFLDPMFVWHQRRCEEADKIPVVGRKFYTLRKQSTNGRDMSEEELIQWLDNYLPAFEKWWEQYRGELLLSNENLEALEQSVESLYDQAEEKLTEPSERLDYIDAWFELFEFAKEESLSTHQALDHPWGSFIIALLKDGIPRYLVNYLETELRHSENDGDALFADALQAYLDDSDKTLLLDLLEELSQGEGPQAEECSLFL